MAYRAPNGKRIHQASLSQNPCVSLRRPAAPVPPPLPILTNPGLPMIPTLPREGADHPLFARMDPLDGLELFLCHPRREPLGDNGNTAIEAWYQDLRSRISAVCRADAGPLAWWNNTATRLALAKVEQPAVALKLMLWRAESHPLAVNQILIRRGPMNERGDIAESCPDPRAPAAYRSAPQSNEELWNGTFAAETAPFASIAEDISLIVVTTTRGAMLTETRFADPYHPRVRIIGYLGSIEKIPPQADDSRAQQLARALRAALAERWPTGLALPRLTNREGCDDLPYLDRIDWLGRSGFAFAALRDNDRMVQPLLDSVRCREQEILDAATDVIESCDLFPALNWERANGALIFNLWEKA